MDESVRHKIYRKRIGILLFVLMNVVVVGVTAYVDFGKQDHSKNDLKNMDPILFLAVVGCFVVSLIAESAKYYIMIKHTSGLKKPKTAFSVTAVGKYYDNITPLGAGGQPFQALYLMKRGVPNGTATAIPVAGFLSSQLAFIIIALAVLIFGSGVMKLVTIKVAAIVGLLFYAFIPLAIVLFTLLPKVGETILRFIIKVLAKIKIIKKPEAAEAKAIATLQGAKESIVSIYKGRHIFVRMLLLSLVYHIAVCSMPYFILHAFGSDLGFLSVFCMTVFIYLCITFVPTPGNSGVAEGSFYALFSVLGQGNLFWAMLVWRFFCYYMFIAAGLGVIAYDAIEKRRTKHDPSL